HRPVRPSVRASASTARCSLWTRCTSAAITSPATVSVIHPRTEAGSRPVSAMSVSTGTVTRPYSHCTPKWRAKKPCCFTRRRRRLLHEPPVAHHQRLPGERTRFEAREQQRHFSHVMHGGELAIHRLLQHHGAHHVGLADAQCLRLLGNLLVH